MLIEFLSDLKDSFSFFNLFQYITFRSGLSAIMALLISFIIGPWVIHILHKNQIGEEIRLSGPKTHMKKRGTPTMGGVIILTAVLLPTLLFSKINSPFVQIILFATIWMGFIGFLDDYLKIIKKLKKGLIARYKMAGQIILGCIISYWVFQLPEYSSISTITTVPFLKNVEIDLGLFYPLMVIIVITGTSNAVNLTDGLDGLAAGLLAICFTVFSAIAYISGRIDFSNYLNKQGVYMDKSNLATYKLPYYNQKNNSLEFNLDNFEDELHKNKINLPRVDLVLKIQRILKAKKNHGKHNNKSCVSWKVEGQEVDKGSLLIEGEYVEITGEINNDS